MTPARLVQILELGRYLRKGSNMTDPLFDKLGISLKNNLLREWRRAAVAVSGGHLCAKEQVRGQKFL
jgi:hypothetical protein